MNTPPFAILRLPAVKARCGLSRSSLYSMMAKGAFPRSISIGPRAIGWASNEIDAWIESRVAESRKRLPAAQGPLTEAKG